MSDLIQLLSGEYLLRSRPNGGGVVLARSILVSLILYLLALAIKEMVKPGALFEFSQTAFKNAVSTTIPWFGAIFAATYASFYTRYSSQWTYLANTYNYFMAVKSSIQPQSNDAGKNKSLVNWQAGFVSDCFTLHLDRKPIFQGVISELIKDVDLKIAILDNFAGEDKQEFIRRHMTDNLNIRQPQDRTKINVNEAWEVKYWTQYFGVSEQQLKASVKAVGVSVAAVKRHLGK